MMHGQLPTPSFSDNERHVMAFQPISEAAHSLLYDNQQCLTECHFS